MLRRGHGGPRRAPRPQTGERNRPGPQHPRQPHHERAAYRARRAVLGRSPLRLGSVRHLFLVSSEVGIAVFAFPDSGNAVGAGFRGTAFLTVTADIYAIGPISGGHFNPAVSVGHAIAGRSGGTSRLHRQLDPRRCRRRRSGGRRSVPLPRRCARVRVRLQRPGRWIAERRYCRALLTRALVPDGGDARARSGCRWCASRPLEALRSSLLRRFFRPPPFPPTTAQKAAPPEWKRPLGDEPAATG